MLNMIHQLGDKTVIRDGHNWIADSAKVIGNIHLKNESSVWFGAVLRGDIEKITLAKAQIFKIIVSYIQILVVQ